MSRPELPLVPFRVGALLLVVAVLWGWFDVRRRARTSDVDPQVHKTDITVYTGAGAAMFDGRDPYLVSSPRGWHYLYPPLLAIALSPLAHLPTTEQAMVWYALSCLWLVGIAAELRRLWRWRAEQQRAEQQTPTALPAWLTWAVIAGLALPTLNCLQRGQVGVCVVYFLLLGARWVLCSTTKRGILLGGLILALPVAIKLTPLLPAAVLAGGLLMQDFFRWFKRKQAASGDIATSLAAAQPGRYAIARGVYACLGGAAGLLVWFLLVPAITIGHTMNMNHLRTWVARVVATDNVGAVNDFNFKSKRNQSLDNGVRRLGNLLAYAFAGGPDDQLVDYPHLPQVPMPMETAAVDRGLKLAVLGILLGLAALVLRTAWSDSLAAWPAVLGLASLATTTVSPLSWGHHYVIAAPALLFVPALLVRPSQPRAGLRLAASGAALLIAHYALIAHTGRIGLLGIGMSIWLTTALVITLMHVQRQFQQQSEPATVSSEIKVPRPLKRAA